MATATPEAERTANGGATTTPEAERAANGRAAAGTGARTVEAGMATSPAPYAPPAEPSWEAPGTGREYAPLPPPQHTERARWPMVAAGVVIVIVGLVAALIVMGGGQGDDDPQATGTGGDTQDQGNDSTTEQPATTTVAGLTVDEAFTLASGRLEDAGSFTYSGTTQASDVNPIRPGLWLAVELSVDGEVDLTSSSVHEIATVTSGKATETVTDGMTVWGRLGDAVDDLTDELYLTVGEPEVEPPTRRGVALLPGWIDASIDREELPDDGSGRRTFRATLPAEALGELEDGRDLVPAELVVTLDRTGDPVHVEVTAAPEGPTLRLVLDIADLGDPMSFDFPAVDDEDDPSDPDSGSSDSSDPTDSSGT